MAGAPGLEPGSAGLESASLSFSLRPFSMHQEGFEPTRSYPSHSFTGCCRAVSASDARLRKTFELNSRFGEKLSKAGGRTRALHSGGRRPRLRHLKVLRLSNNKRKERALWLPHRKQARSGQVSTNFLEIWEREARPRCINAVIEDDPCAASLRVEGRRPESSDRHDLRRTNSDRRSATPPRPYTGRTSVWRPAFRSAPRVSLCSISSSSEVSLLLKTSAARCGRRS